MNSNYALFCPENSTFTDEDLDDTIKIREVSYMTLCNDEDSIPHNSEELNEFEQYRKDLS